MKKDIVHKWHYNHSPELVWECLTNSEILVEWFMENDFKPIVGHKFMFNAKPKIKLGFDGKIYCEVLEVVPFQKLSYTWKGGPRPGKITLDSVVTWTLTKKDNGTEVLLEHSGFTGMRNYLTYLIMNKGWMVILKKKLEKALNKR